MIYEAFLHVSFLPLFPLQHPFYGLGLRPFPPQLSVILPFPLQDPFNMAFTGTDELKLSQSFGAIRLDVMVCHKI